MNYISFSFALFVFLAALAYYLLPISFRRYVLLSFSLFFYIAFDARYIPFLLFVGITTFCTAKVTKRWKKVPLILCLILNVGMWFLIKVIPPLIDRYNLLPIDMASIIVPVGISYYLLQAISYLVDVYRNVIPAEKDFSKYLLYLSYFPTVVQGPISRYAQLSPALDSKEPFNTEMCIKSLLLVTYGLIKKMVIADRLAIFVNHCFQNVDILNGFVLYLGAVGYAFQLYMDFSGCVDICRGVSGVFGIKLIQNFNAPYLSKSIHEFWNRWHISLSSWLKDYIYIPLGGNRKGTLRKNINLLITFGISGVWHGAFPSFWVWGFLNALYQIVGAYTIGIRKRIKRVIGIVPDSSSDKLYRTIITFHLTLIAWIFFRSGSVSLSLAYIRNIISDFNIWMIFSSELFGPAGYPAIIVAALHICLILYMEIKQITPEIFIERICNLHFLLRYSIYMLVLLDLLIWGVYGSGYDMSGFLYGGF